MIGFDEFIILNDKSTDDTQCILDAYSREGIVKRVPEDIPDVIRDDATPIMIETVDRVFDICAQHLTSQNTWMVGHDVDEFVWIRQNASLADTVTSLTAQGSHASIHIPRLLFGSSNHETYEDDLVLKRFTRRFDIDSCHGQQHGRRLFNRRKPASYCEEERGRRGSIDNHKCLSLVSALAKTCVNRQQNPVTCQRPHYHVLRNSPNASHDVLWLPAGAPKRRHPKILRNVNNQIMIMHYMTKSREEFYQRTCSSVWQSKYFQCPTCTVESYFNLTEEYANNFEDKRMIPLAEKLRKVLEASSIGAACNTSFSRQSREYYQECFRQDN